MPWSTSQGPPRPQLPEPPSAESWHRAGGVTVTVLGGPGGGLCRQTCGACALRAGLWGWRQQSRVGQAGSGLGWDVPLGMIAPESLPSSCCWEESRPLTSPGWTRGGWDPSGAELPGLRFTGCHLGPWHSSVPVDGLLSPLLTAWPGEKSSHFCWPGATGQPQCV